jgi:hypothetical protein
MHAALSMLVASNALMHECNVHPDAWPRRQQAARGNGRRVGALIERAWWGDVGNKTVWQGQRSDAPHKKKQRSLQEGGGGGGGSRPAATVGEAGRGAVQENTFYCKTLSTKNVAGPKLLIGQVP